ncbi:MAG: LlaJI family restriction endonuclease, partial [Fusobacteriaceae bacterium]
MLNKKDSELEIIFFIENKYYLKSEITGKENISEKEVLELFQKNILCEGKNKEIKFEYVGIISLEKSCLIILPKYLKQENFENIKFEYGKFIYKIIEKYSKNIKTNEINIYDGEEENNFFQKLPLYKYLIEFFHNNGLYEREKEINEINGDGEISWEKTIEDSEMFLDNGGNPFYFDMHTQEYVNDEVHYIRELHKFLLNKASLYLKSFSKISGENYNEIYFPVNEHLFDDDNLIIINLERELHETFDEKNLNLLKTMKILVEEKDYNFNSDIYFFGTKYFYNVWEVALQEFFGHDKNNNLIKEFVPRWKNLVNGKTENGYPIIPDIIKIVDKTF